MSIVLKPMMIDGIECFSADVAKAYADYPEAGFELTDENAAKSFWVASRNRLFQWLVHQHLSAIGRTRLLEIGCGTGDFVGRIHDDQRLQITGSEVYLEGLAFAKRRMPDARFIQFDVTQGTIGETFDIITAFDVLEHIENDRTAIANINAMLPSGGVAIISVPQHPFLWSRLDDIVRHKRRYSRSEMNQKLVDNGFAILRATSFVFALFPMMILSRVRDRSTDVATDKEDVSLERRVTFTPSVNKICDLVMRLDEWLIRRGISLPFGGTLVVVARKQ